LRQKRSEESSANASVRAQQRTRFLRLFGWSIFSSTLVTIALQVVTGNLLVSLSFLGLMIVMAAFLSAYWTLVAGPQGTR